MCLQFLVYGTYETGSDSLSSDESDDDMSFVRREFGILQLS